MTIARFARYLPIVGMLVMSGAAHAQSARQIIDGWADDLAVTIERRPPGRREDTMKGLTTKAQNALAAVACSTDKEATATTELVKNAKENKKLPITYTYQPSCDLTAKKLKVKFTLDSVATDTPQDKADAATLDKIKQAVATWGETAAKVVFSVYDAKKAKADIDAATATAKAALSGLPCRPLAPPDIRTLVDQEVKKQRLDFKLDISSECDEQKRTVSIKFDVTEIKMASHAAGEQSVKITVENKVPSADELKQMKLQENDHDLSVEVVDLAAGAVHEPTTIQLAARRQKTLMLSPAAGGDFKIKLDVSFRGQKCLATEINAKPGKIIQFTLKTISPSPLCAMSMSL